MENKNDQVKMDSAMIYACPMHPEIWQDTPGLCPECGMQLLPQRKEVREKVLYTCPMHPEVMREKPGLCPECGMNLIPTKVKESGAPMHNGSRPEVFDKHAGHKTNIFATKFWISLILTVPVVLYSELPKIIFDWQAPIFAGSEYLSLVLGTIVFFYGGWVFTTGAWRELRARLPGMMTLIGLAIWAAYSFSIWQVIRGEEHTLFWELTTLITIMLLGHWMEMRAVQGAQSALKELSKLLPDIAEVIRGDKTEKIMLSELREGDIVIVRPGGKIPADGAVIDGRSQVNESLITGESRPVIKEIGKEVVAGSINGDGGLKIKVSKIGEHTFLAGVMRLVTEAQASKSRLQILSDRAAYFLTIIAVASGFVTFLVWFFVRGDIAFSVERLVAVLVVACPHALGLAVPLVASISTTLAARNGFLVKQRLALEMARNIDIVLFDKTGTLTNGEYGVEKIWPIGVKDENEVLKTAASVDARSEHFVSRAIVKATRARNILLPEIKDFVRLSGKGVRGIMEGKEVYVGGEAILEYGDKSVLDSFKNEISEENKKGKTIIFVIKDKKILGAISLADLIREESRSAISDLKQMGVRVAMITGDSSDVAKWVADDLKIDEYFAKVMPAEKSDKVKLLQSKGLKVAMVGDGINDAPALTRADLGIAIGAGTNVAIESAGIILVKNDPRDIVKIIRLSRSTYNKMIQNLFWATGYNVIALPLAAGVLVSKGVILQPALAAVFMSFSTVIVAVNALFLKNKKL